MPLLFDLTASQPFATWKRHGGGKYCEMLFMAMIQRNVNFAAFYDSSKYINPVVLEHAKKKHIHLFDVSKQTLESIVSNHNISAIYSAIPEQLLPWPNCKILGTIHGLRAVELPFDFFSIRQRDFGLIGLNSILAFFNYKKNQNRAKNHYKKLLNANDFFFVTDSDHSKQVIKNLCGKSDIPVFFPPSTTNKLFTRINKKYFLLVSADRYEKNCIRVIIALDRLYSKGLISSSSRTKITGLASPNFKYKLRNKDFFDFLGYVEEDELNSLYANCGCFIYPSLNEGFGYPPLEAMQYGVPVIASNVTSIPEVCGNAVQYVNPKSIKSIEDAIVKTTDENFYEILSQKGFEQYKNIANRQKEDVDKLINWILSHLSE